MNHICFVAGDPSGDVHAAHLIHALRKRNPELRFSGLGGPAMENAGMELLQDLTKAAAIGPIDAARHVSQLLDARKQLKTHLEKTRPDRLVLIDFGDYNLPFIAPIAHRLEIPITYFISPQIWAWGRWRLRLLKRYIQNILVLFKFEEDFYRERGIDATCVGHPLLDQAKTTLSLEEARHRANLNPWRMTVGLLPGSRRKEISRNLPAMLRAAETITKEMPGVQFLIARAPGIPLESLVELIEPTSLDITVTDGSVYDSLQLMDAAVVASGTATLDTAIIGIPMVIVYRVSTPTYWFAKSMLKIPYVGLANIVAGKQIVPELLQHHAQPKKIANALIPLLRDPNAHKHQCEALALVREKLGAPGAIERAAEFLLKLPTKGTLDPLSP